MFRYLSPGAISIRTDLAGTIALAQRHGWQGVDLPIVEAAQLAAERGVAAVEELFAQAGMRLGGWGLPIDWRKDYDRAALAALGEQAALGQRLGCSRVSTWLLPASDDLPFRENFDHLE
jgi:hypothetical protein